MSTKYSPRILISDVLLHSGVLLSRLGCERAARCCVELSIKVGLPGVHVRFNWLGVEVADIERQKKT